MNNTVIEAVNLSRQVPGSANNFILKDINLAIHSAERVIITGPSGCGKTTLLHLLAGLDGPSSGSVRCLGNDWSQMSSARASQVRAQDIGFVFQFHHLLDGLSVRDNLLLPLLIGGVEANDRIALDLMDQLHLSPHKLHQDISVLSGGEKQRVALGRAIIHRPRIVFLDEPTGCLDQANAKSLWALLLELQAQLDLTVIAVTHDENLLDSDCRSLQMVDGNIL